MPRSPSRLRILPSAQDDLQDIQQHNPDHAARLLKRIESWRDKIQWGRVPQDHLKYLTGGSYNFYREQVGTSGYRVIYEISNDVMTVVAVLPKSDDTYDLGELQRRINRA